MSRFPSTPDLDLLFRPRSVAVAGASTNVDSPGHDYLESLKAQGFTGPIYPINPRAEEVAGLKAYPRLADVPGQVDLVISCVPASAVLELVEHCGERGVRFLHLFTGRFSETGDEDAANLRARNRRKCRRQGHPHPRPQRHGPLPPGGRPLLPPRPPPRTAAASPSLSQSGNNAVEVITRGNARGLKFGKVANYGNGLDVTPGEMLRYLADDPETSVIGAYVEGVPDGRGFFEGLSAAAAQKPVVVHKAGRTAAGARSAASPHRSPRRRSRTLEHCPPPGRRPRGPQPGTTARPHARRSPPPARHRPEHRRGRGRGRPQRPVGRRLRRERPDRCPPAGRRA
ncbi:MAG: CoA-binding protein [Dehalococcoidia bacterium]|nr:CoA-binding protein [Dehalococcoidia bacterium]